MLIISGAALTRNSVLSFNWRFALSILHADRASDVGYALSWPVLFLGGILMAGGGTV